MRGTHKIWIYVLAVCLYFTGSQYIDISASAPVISFHKKANDIAHVPLHNVSKNRHLQLYVKTRIRGGESHIIPRQFIPRIASVQAGDKKQIRLTDSFVPKYYILSAQLRGPPASA